MFLDEKVFNLNNWSNWANRTEHENLILPLKKLCTVSSSKRNKIKLGESKKVLAPSPVCKKTFLAISHIYVFYLLLAIFIIGKFLFNFEELLSVMLNLFAQFDQFFKLNFSSKNILIIRFYTKFFLNAVP